MEDVLPCKFASIRRHISTAFFENLTLGRAAAARLSALAARVRACRSNLRQVFSRQAAKGGCGSATRAATYQLGRRAPVEASGRRRTGISSSRTTTVRNSPSQAKAHDSPTYPGAPVNPTSKNRQTKMSEVVIGAPIANVESSTSVYAIDGIYLQT
jgi:type II secretory pathway pseudopilin PulG